MMTVSEINSLIARRIISRLPEPGNYISAEIEGLHMHRRDRPENIACGFDVPVVSLMISGKKHIKIGTEEFCYEKNQCFIVGLDVPTSGFISEASPKAPCMTVALNIDRNIISQLASGITPGREENRGVAAVTADADGELLDSFLRLINILDKPESIPVLAPLIIKEIHYRLLISPMGERLRMISTLGTSSNRVAEAVNWLKENFRETLYVNELAARSNMAPSTFHRHFKDMTAFSPVQYQKRLRLYEARRLMVSGRMNAASAGYEVGYESPTQFIKEYKRMFGEPPKRDVGRMHAV